jgi:hypothetical protein
MSPQLAACAPVDAGVEVVEVGVIALFDARLDQPVAARGQLAGAEAGVAVLQVGVVALLDPGPHDRVAAARLDAGVQARVGVVIVTIVAGLVALEDTVAAGRPGARVGAVGVDRRVAGLAGADEAVAAGRRQAGARARVLIVGVGVVALLARRRHLAVAAVREEAARARRALAGPVGVVALDARLARVALLDRLVDDPVAAALDVAADAVLAAQRLPERVDGRVAVLVGLARLTDEAVAREAARRDQQQQPGEPGARRGERAGGHGHLRQLRWSRM